MDVFKCFFELIAKTIKRKDIRRCDYLLFPGGAQLLQFLKRREQVLPPAIYCTDALFHQMIDYYWYDIPHRICQQADNLEKEAIEMSALIILSSDWARNCAIHQYGCPKEKVEVIEFGANIEEEDVIPANPYKSGEMRILFSGVDWKRKGGDIAVETVRKLNADGIKARLFLVGIDKRKIPANYLDLQFVEYVGFLNKNRPNEYKKYVEIVRNSHCLLLPTRAECSSIVLCEAAAFGLPVFTYNTGGLNNYVVDKRTGHLLNTNATPDDFANSIKTAIDNKELDALHYVHYHIIKKK